MPMTASASSRSRSRRPSSRPCRPALAPVPELDRLVLAGGGPRGHGRAARGARLQDHVDLDGRVPARVEDLARVDLCRCRSLCLHLSSVLVCRLAQDQLGILSSVDTTSSTAAEQDAPTGSKRVAGVGAPASGSSSRTAWTGSVSGMSPKISPPRSSSRLIWFQLRTTSPACLGRAVAEHVRVAPDQLLRGSGRPPPPGCPARAPRAAGRGSTPGRARRPARRAAWRRRPSAPRRRAHTPPRPCAGRSSARPARGPTGTRAATAG